MTPEKKYTSSGRRYSSAKLNEETAYEIGVVSKHQDVPMVALIDEMWLVYKKAKGARLYERRPRPERLVETR